MDMTPFRPLNLAELYKNADGAAMQAMSMQTMAMQQSEMRQEYDTKEAMRALARNSVTTGPDGQPTMDLKAMSRGIYGIDPMQGVAFDQAQTKAQRDAADLALKNAELDEKNAKMGVEKLKIMGNAATAPLLKYKELVEGGMPDAEARKQVQPIHQAAMRSLIDSNLFKPQELAGMRLLQNPEFDPQLSEAAANATADHKEQFSQWMQKKGLTLKFDEFTETKRHNAATEGQADASQKETARHHQTLEGDPDKNEQTAQAIAAGKLAPLSGFALSRPAAQNVMARVVEINPDFDPTQFATRQKAEKDFATGKQGNSVRSFNVALAHLDTLDQLATALNNKDTQAINKIGNTLATMTGSTAPTNFEAAKKIVADEVVKAIVGSGGGVGDRDEAAKTINAANSPAQLKGVINTYKDMMRGQIGGLRDQYKAGTGKDDFDTKYLSEAGRQAAHGASPKAPAVGAVEQGYRFKGGDPAKPESWEKVN